MSIIDFETMKVWLRHNQADIAIFIGFILVALAAFGAGRFSAPEIVRNPVVIDESGVSTAPDLSAAASLAAPEQKKTGPAGASQGLFVASRGGTKYHWSWCSYGEKIKESNQVWFNSEAEAQAAGYSPCACIASKAPAGYVKPGT